MLASTDEGSASQRPDAASRGWCVSIVRAWPDLPNTRLLADVSLWSANLANLATEIQYLDPYADSFHLDVSDARFAPSLLFFPDLVRALRPLTNRPFHVHLIVELPTTPTPEFLASAADV